MTVILAACALMASITDNVLLMAVAFLTAIISVLVTTLLQCSYESTETSMTFNVLEKTKIYLSEIQTIEVDLCFKKYHSFISVFTFPYEVLIIHTHTKPYVFCGKVSKVVNNEYKGIMSELKKYIEERNSSKEHLQGDKKNEILL